MHRLGESFVEKVIDVRRRVTTDGKAAAPGESLEFLALIQGWQSEARRERREQLLRLNDIGLKVALEHAKVKDIFFIPEVHFAEEKPMLADDDGWWYQVRSVIWCRTCRKCRVRKEPGGFTRKEWRKERPATCIECDGAKGVARISSKETNRTRNRVKHPPNPQARRPRAAQGKGGAVKDVTSGSEDDGVDGVEWGAGMYGVRMTPAHPWYVGRGDDKCGGEVVYSIQDIRQLLSVQPEDTKRWLTTSQMGWALTREENELVNAKDEREGKPVARQLAPMISKFVRAQWESEEMENADDERRQLLEEAMELDHIWGIWDGEEESTYEHHNWIRQPSQSGNDMRHHIEVHASHREQVWESPSASLIEQDPEVIPDVDIAAKVGQLVMLEDS